MVKRVLLVIGPGQSNEYGASEEVDCNVGMGAPLRDPGYPNGSPLTRSMWPRLAGLAGDLGVWLGVRNHAVGSTNAADAWVGRCRTWVNPIAVTRGSYVLYAGNVYKCACAASTVVVSTTAPAVGTGADSVPWTLARAAIAEDTDKRIYASSSALFDPNGYMSGCAASITGAIGYDQIVSVISIGQGDKTLSVSRLEYATALKNATSYLLAAGATKVAIGFTCTGNTAGLTAWYDSDLVPGRQDALDSFAGDPRVVSGANLYARMPTLPTSPADKNTPGLKADLLHMNNAALAIASDAWRDALVSAGIF